MSSKVLVLLGLMAVLVLFLSSEVAARDLAGTSSNDVKETSATETRDVNDAKYGGGCYPPYCGRSGGGYYPPYHGGGSYPPYHGGGRGCYYGRCCGYGRCRCCAYEGEVIEAKPEN